MYSLEDVEKKKNPKTGLVALKIVKPWNPYAAGTIAGFPPNVATQHLNNEVAVLAGSKDKSPVQESGAPAPVPGSEVYASGTKYDQRPEISPNAQTAPGTLSSPAPAVPKAEIPEGWRDLGGAAKRSLAANLSQRPYIELSIADSERIIEAAAAGEPLPATDTGPNELGDKTTPTNGIVE